MGINKAFATALAKCSGLNNNDLQSVAEILAQVGRKSGAQLSQKPEGGEEGGRES